MFNRDGVRFLSFWRLQIMGWVSFYILVLLGSIPEMRHPGALGGEALAVALMFFGSFLLHPVCRSLLGRCLPWIAFELRTFAWSVMVGTVGAFACEVILGETQWVNLATNSVQFSVVLFLWCSLYFSVKQWQQLTQERERLLRAETDAREARLSALRYQLNPHFLFNSLNAVSTLVLDGNAPAASRMLAQIAELLRASLENEVIPEVLLSQEIAFTERYLAIEQTRLGERLQVHIAISSATLDALVPSMLLQPLAENAIRHGITQLVSGGSLEITSALTPGRLRIVIRNSGRTDSKKQNETGDGIGLRNTAERLKTLYGTDHKLSLDWPTAGGCQVTVELPFRKITHPQEALTCAP